MKRKRMEYRLDRLSASKSPAPDSPDPAARGSAGMERRRISRRSGSIMARDSGFTLVELVLVILVLGLVSAIFTRAFEEGNRMFQTVDARKELTQEARMGLMRMVREIRQVRSSSDVLAADAETFSFYGISDSLFTIRFSGVPGGDVTLRRGSVTQKLLAEVDSLAFDYYKSDGSPAVPLVNPNATDVFRVGIFLRLARGGYKVSLQTSTFLRNLQ